MTLLERNEIASYFKACLNLNFAELKSARDLPSDLKMEDSGLSASTSLRLDSFRDKILGFYSLD